MLSLCARRKLCSNFNSRLWQQRDEQPTHPKLLWILALLILAKSSFNFVGKHISFQQSGLLKVFVSILTMNLESYYYYFIIQLKSCGDPSHTLPLRTKNLKRILTACSLRRSKNCYRKGSIIYGLGLVRGCLCCLRLFSVCGCISIQHYSGPS